MNDDTQRLDFLGTGKHKDIGLDYDTGDTIIFEVRGNLNDRQWHELGRGATLREAIDDAMENSTK